MRFVTATVLLLASAATYAQPSGTNKVFRDCSDCPEMVTVPAGSFLMGSPTAEAGRDATEGPQVAVTLPKPIAVGKFEVTQAQYAAFAKATGRSATKACGYRPAVSSPWAHDKPELSWLNPGVEQKKDHPVICVTWDDAKAYVTWLSSKTKRSYRLLTDAEWEYIARAGATTSRPWGDKADEACSHANVADQARDRKMAPGQPLSKGAHNCDDRFAGTSPVGSFKANAFGLHDVVGNAWEWVEDCWQPTLTGAPTDGAARVTGDCSQRTVRGGSWFGPPPGGSRLAKRSFAGYATPYFNLGFRVAASP